MSPEERIGQLMLVSFNGTSIGPDLREMLTQWHVGGVIYFGPNVGSPASTRCLNRRIRQLSKHHPAPFIAIDHEGGTVVRLHKGVTAIPSQMALGATASPELARRAGAAVGHDLRALGFTMNIAPDLDVVRNQASAIGTRSFGDRPDLVATLGRAFIKGQSAAGVVSVAKHFVGEGEVAGDSHDGTLVMTLDRTELEADILPFREAIADGLPAIMTSHVAAPEITHTRIPLTFCPEVVTGLLRRDLSFDGIVITDALEMPGPLALHDVGELAVEAIEAGADMVLSTGYFDDRKAVHERLLAAYREGRLADFRVRASLRRILRAKIRFAADGPPSGKLGPSSALATDVARAAVTVIGNLPQSRRHLRDGRASVAYLGPDLGIAGKLGVRSAVLGRRLRNGLRDEANRVVKEIGRPTILVGAFANRSQVTLIRRVAALTGAHVIAISLGNPHDLALIPDPELIVATYSSSAAAVDTVLSVLEAGRAPSGRLPIALASPLLASDAGHGLHRQ